MTRCSLIVLVLCITSCSVRWSLAAQQGCEFYFSEQPPTSLPCDPYQQRQLKMECTVHGPILADFELVWFSLRLQEEPGVASMMRNSSDVTIRFQLHQDGAVKSIRSRLQLQLSGEDEAPSDTAFWCSVLARRNDTVSSSFSDGGKATQILLPSEPFVLRVAGLYANLPVCGDAPRSSAQEKCATSDSGPLLQLPSQAPTTSPSPREVPSILPSSSLLHRPLASSSSTPEETLLPVETALLEKPPQLREGGTGLAAIVFPTLAAVAGVFASLSLLTCLYLHCHYRRKIGDDGAARKKMVEATYHTYSLPSTLSSHQLKGLGGRSNFSISSPALSASHRARSHKLEECCHDFGMNSHDQYVEMRSPSSHSSCPTLHRTGLFLPSSLSDYGSARFGFSYEVPVPFHLEPEYSTIPSPYVPYLIPIQSKVEHRLLEHENCQVKRQQSLKSGHELWIGSRPELVCDQPSASAPASPSSHDYEQLIHTSANSAYRELAVMVADERDSVADERDSVADERDSDDYTMLGPTLHSSAATPDVGLVGRGEYTALTESDSPPLRNSDSLES